jgi:RNA polymerase sigma factor (sigma-70 family)
MPRDPGQNIRAVKDSEGGAVLEEWFARYRPVLHAYFLRRTRNVADAEDLTQDAFVRLLRLDSSASIRDIEAFLFCTAANLLRDRARRRSTHPVAAIAIENLDTQDGVPSPLRVLEAKNELRDVVQALESLSDRTRRIFMLRRLEQMKCREIADLFGISVKAVEHHIAKALAHLAKSQS